MVKHQEKGFKLIQLPVVPRQKLMKYLNPTELFEISLCSARMALYVRELRIEAKSHTITLTKGQSSVGVKFEKQAVYWDFQKLFQTKNMRASRTVGGVLFETCLKEETVLGPDEFYCDFKNIEFGAATISKHFQYIFHGPLEIAICPDFIDDMDVLFEEPELRRCRAFEINGAGAPSKEILGKIFDRMIVEKQLTIRPRTDPGYVIKQALQVEWLLLKSSTWMTREHLLQLNCTIGDLKYTMFESADIEAFAENWMKNKESKLEKLRIEWNTDEVFQLKNLPITKWDPSKREEDYLVFSGTGNGVDRIPCGRGNDLERDDGKLMTIIQEQEYDGIYVYFLVWHEPFPNKKRLEQLPKELAPKYLTLENLNKLFPDATSLERLLCRRDLKHNEFLDTLKVFMNFDAENPNRSAGTVARKKIFEEIRDIIVM